MILLDLVLPGINGLETAKRLSSKSRIIFITSYREYAVDALEVEAVHYLLKPVTDERLYQAMDRALNRSKQEDDRTLALIKSGSTHILPIRDILYCEVFDHRVCIHTAQEITNIPERWTCWSESWTGVFFDAIEAISST